MKKILIISFCVIAISYCLNCVLAAPPAWMGDDPVLQNPGYHENDVDDDVKKSLGWIWATVATVVQVFSVGCVVFAGLRYMFASADQKADIKQGMTYLAIGATLVFGAVLIIRLVANVGNSLL